jgi:hypothetical protein
MSEIVAAIRRRVRDHFGKEKDGEYYADRLIWQTVRDLAPIDHEVE